jgi:membrane-bound serine protease (ClpP class)
MRLLYMLLLMFSLAGAAVAQERDTDPGSGSYVMQLTVADAIGPATDDYIERALGHAAAEGAALVVIRMDTPGGLDTAMRGIIKNIVNSPVPVASYVAPSGARAASAGTYILYASHVAAMAPGTNLGAATPIAIGGGFPGGDGEEEPQQGEPEKPASEPAAPKSAGERKALNDAIAYIRGLAQLRGRNAEWAEKAVREAASLPAQEALELGVIDIIAGSVPDLLQQAEGRVVQVQGGERTLRLGGLPLREVEPDWRSRLLSVITNPNVAYILMLLGIYGLILEFSNPGAIVPGTIGAIALLLALYAFQLLPINVAGVALILLGVALMVAEAFEPSFGMLGIGGVIAFVFGSIILIDTEVPGFGIDLSVIVIFAITSVLLFVFAIGMAFKARHRPVVSGMEQIIGSEAVALADFEGQGTVAVHSEIWSATTRTPVHKGDTLRITGFKGLVLEVEPVTGQDEEKMP